MRVSPTLPPSPGMTQGERPDGELKYRVFISYSHTDAKWASWLLRRLEAYRVPPALHGRAAPIGRVGARLAPVFRDREELPSSSDLGAAIRAALVASATLVVICSRTAAKSRWVQEEIVTFKRLRGEERVFALVVDGEPNAEGTVEDCFSPALRRQLGADGQPSAAPAEHVAADARPHGDGREDAFVRLVAGLLGVGFDDLRQRQLRRRYRVMKWISAVLVLALGVAGQVTWRAVESERAEIVRSSRTDARNGARLLEEGNAADGIAYLVRAAGKDPLNPTVAPRLASVLASRSFLLPEGLVARHPARVLWVRFADEAQSLGVLWEDGAYGHLAISQNRLEEGRLPAPPLGRTSLVATRSCLIVPCADGVVRVLDHAGRFAREFRFDAAVERISTGEMGHTGSGDLFVAYLANKTLVVADAASGRRLGQPIPADKPVYVTLGPKWILWCDAPNRELGFLPETAHLRDTTTGETETVLSVPFGGFEWVTSPAGDAVAVLRRIDSGSELHLQLWSVATGQPITPPARIDDTHFNRTSRASGVTVFTADGSHLVTWYARCTVWARDGATKIADIPGLGDFAGTSNDQMEFSPDGRTLATWSRIGALELWDVATGQPRVPALRHTGNVIETVFSADGSLAMTSATDGLARIWEVATGRLAAEPVLQQDSAPPATLAADGSRLAIGTVRGEVYQYRLDRRRAQPLKLPMSSPTVSAPFFPGPPPRLYFLERERLRVLDVASAREAPGGVALPEPIRIIGNSFTSVRADLQVMVIKTVAGEWQAWWLGEGKVEKAVVLQEAPATPNNDVDYYFGYVKFSPHGDAVALVVAAVAGRNYDASKGDGQLRVWDLHTGRPMGPPIAVDKEPIFSYFPEFSPDGRRVTLGSSPGQSMKIWDIASGRVAVDLGPAARGVRMGVFSPDGTRLVTANREQDVRMWDAATGKQVGPPLFHSDGVLEAVFSPDGAVVATHSVDGVLHFWDGHTGAPVGETIENRRGSFRSIRFSRDGRRIITANNDGTARVWDVTTSQPLTDPMVHEGRIPAAGLSPDERFVLTELNAQMGFQIWAVPPPLPPRTKTPQWLLDLATIAAGRILDAEGRFASAAALYARLEDIRRSVAQLPEAAPYAEWGRWFLADPGGRSIAPGFSLTAAEADRAVDGFRVVTPVSGPAR